MRSFTATSVVVLLAVFLLAGQAFAQVPPAPTALAPSNITASAFQANWDSSGYGQYHIMYYHIDVSSDPNFTIPADNVVVNGIADPPWYNVTGVASFVTYYYRLRAVNASGESGNSNVVAAPIAVPTTADGATNITATGFTAHWEPQNGVTGYKLDIAMLKSFGPVVHTSVWDSLVGNVTSFTISGLIPDTTYYYRVRTVSLAGESENSNYIGVSRVLSASPFPSGTIGVPYNETVQFDGTAAPVTWAIVGGALPTGLSIDAGSGTISGTPTALGTFTFTVQVTDNTPATVTKQLSIAIVATPTIGFDAVVGNRYAYFDGANGPPTHTWDHTVGKGANRILVVQAGATSKVLSHTTVVSVTYAGKAMTQAKQQSESEPYGGDYINVGEWYMLDKDLPTDSLPHPVLVTFADSITGAAGGSISLIHAKQAAPEAVVSDSGLVNQLTAHITTLTNHAWLIQTAVNGYSGSFFVGHNQEQRYQIDNGNFDIMGDSKEVLTAGPDSMQANHHIQYRMAQVVVAVAPEPSSAINARLKFYLQGPYVTSADTMSNGLKKTGLLASHFATATIPAFAVDSVNIEIRDSAAAAKAGVRAFAPAWLMTDGTIRDFVDTTKNYVGYTGVPAGKYYIVVRHRNHLAIMSNVRDSLDAGLTPALYDFSTGQGQAYGTNAMIQVGTHFALIGGNTNNADQVINAGDRVAARNNSGLNTFIPSDATLDGVVNAADRVLARNNAGQASQVP